MSTDTTISLPSQDTCRQEWRDLCFTLEMAQANDLIQACRDKFEFAKTLSQFGAQLDETIATVRQRAKEGNVRFFSDRGIPSAAIDEALVEWMLRDWRAAVESKKNHASLAFASRFGQSLASFLRNPEHAWKLAQAKSHVENDAILLLEQWARDPDSATVDAADVHAQVAAIVRQYQARYEATTAALRQEVARLKADVARLQAQLPPQPV